MNVEGHLAVAKAAKVIGISGSGLRQLIAQKKVIARKRGVGRSSWWFVPLSEVERLKQVYRFGVANVT
jgi:hypothetical protein